MKTIEEQAREIARITMAVLDVPPQMVDKQKEDDFLSETGLVELLKDKEMLDFLLKRGMCWRNANIDFPEWMIGNETEWLYHSQDGRGFIREAMLKENEK